MVDRKKVIIAPVGKNIFSLFKSLRELNIEKVILLTTKKYEKKTKDVVKDLRKFKIPAEIIKIKNYCFEEVFKVVAEIKSKEVCEVLVNVSTGDNISNLASICAAYINGIKAFDTSENEIKMLPIMKFSYYRLIPDKKMSILKYLYNNPDCCASLEELSKRLGMSLPLISYHVNGTFKSEGLEKMGLVETLEGRRKTSLRLTTLGRLLVKGYVEPKSELK